MTDVEDQIRAMVDRETRAWDERDAQALVELFHPDMVWPWPPDPSAHDPALWILTQGRFDRERWRRGWQFAPYARLFVRIRSANRLNR